MHGGASLHHGRMSLHGLEKAIEADMEEIKINIQTWAQRNLDVGTFRNGDLIFEAKSDKDWEAAGVNGKPAWCYYNFAPENGRKYGKLYNWFAVNDPRGLPPEGWLIPDENDWKALFEFLGGMKSAGGKIKAGNGWNKDGGGTDETGFGGIAGGYCDSDGYFSVQGLYGYWWCMKESTDGTARSYYTGSSSSEIFYDHFPKSYGFPIRCLKKNHQTKITNNISNDIISDKRDKRKYKYVTIGNQTWMAENLDAAVFRNGDPIKEVKSDEEWDKAGFEGIPAWCYYGNDQDIGKKYGKLYNWYAVHDKRGLAPDGWHVPDSMEWQSLADFLGGRETAGELLKSSEGWMLNGNGTDDYGFSAIPGGERRGDGKFHSEGRHIKFSSEEGGVYGAQYILIEFCSKYMVISNINKTDGLYVRCVRNEPDKAFDSGEESGHHSESAAGKGDKSVQLGTQRWAIKNLDTDTFRNGDPIPEIRSDEEWEEAGKKGKPGWCYYNNDPSNGDKYGKLYNWHAVGDKRGLAPKGWHVCSDSEHYKLIEFLGEAAAGKLKDSDEWEQPDNDTDLCGFDALPAGIRFYSGKFSSLGKLGQWWHSDWDSETRAHYHSLFNSSDTIGGYCTHKGYGLSVRCIYESDD
jgi:uncharacterized protein (TIGR02145 family)